VQSTVRTVSMKASPGWPTDRRPAAAAALRQHQGALERPQATTARGAHASGRQLSDLLVGALFTPEDGLYIVSVRVQYERGIVVRIVDSPKAWLAIRAASFTKCGCKELLNLLPAVRHKGHVKRREWWRCLDYAEVPIPAAEAKGATILTEGTVTERPQDRLVEAPRAIEISHGDVGVIDDAHVLAAPSNGPALSCEPQPPPRLARSARVPVPNSTSGRLERAVARQLQRLGRRPILPEHYIVATL